MNKILKHNIRFFIICAVVSGLLYILHDDAVRAVSVPICLTIGSIYGMDYYKSNSEDFEDK